MRTAKKKPIESMVLMPRRAKARLSCILIGPQDEQWDLAFVARYPTAGAFLAMITDPQYREAVKHRQAAVLDSRLLRIAETDTGQGFATPQ